MLGLFAFFYACLHVLTYVVLNHFFEWTDMLNDVTDRRFITAGFLAFMLLVPLAITSTTGWVRRLGGRNWQRLHRLIYVSAACAMVHFLWKVKVITADPLRYAAVLVVLLAFRALWRYWPQRATYKPQQP